MGILDLIAEGSKNHVFNGLAAGAVSATTASVMLSLFRKSAGNLNFFLFIGANAAECERAFPDFCV